MKLTNFSAEDAEDAEFWIGDFVDGNCLGISVFAVCGLKEASAKDAKDAKAGKILWRIRGLPQRPGTFCKRSLAADRYMKNHPQVGRKRPLTVLSKCIEQEYLASLASFAEKIFKLDDYTGGEGKVVSKNEVTDPIIFSVFRFLCGKFF